MESFTLPVVGEEPQSLDSRRPIVRDVDLLFECPGINEGLGTLPCWKRRVADGVVGQWSILTVRVLMGGRC